MIGLETLSKYSTPDVEKQRMIDDLLHPQLHSLVKSQYDFCESKAYYIEPTKYCPKCLRKYHEEENFCPECLVSLKHIKDVDIKLIKSDPQFKFIKSNEFNSFEEIFTQENKNRIDEFDFSTKDYNRILRNIKKSSITTFDNLIRSNEILLDDLKLFDKILLYAKSFVEVDFKSYGQELGYFSFNRITLDDRQTVSLQITTLIHELAHFILKEIMTEILCTLLDCSKNSLIESIAVFILSYSPFTQLIDEYSAHNCEGRFTLYGYQDYSSFIQIEKSLDGEMTADEIEITKSIGNNFSVSIKDILESYIDWDLRSDIKDQFLKDVIDEPNYEMLALENCNKLTDIGFLKAIWLIVSEGFSAASQNRDKLEMYETNF
ncbi:hypothetical protein TL18_04715 [Methanobrevibacter sp. YE315]|uniref:hypothetical protein n=1 Tax=Methanobrevibacter sp. YE315 TaxID=1609968 RepID=UPI000764D99D|nr:hypothetical protein [Methanobrevibacter sp. YE315]AMD17380.1 hypothetical protein TL18_04715 [Methanobrevibacter sp. YE315]